MEEVLNAENVEEEATDREEEKQYNQNVGRIINYF
jgi:hypothetical protein